jgi:arabinan endo-1,5-alpha-L-arabinosidase
MPHHPTLLQRLLPLFLFFCFLLPALSAREVRVHDPVVAREGDNYYLFSTGPGIPFFKSKDLKHWSRAGRVFESSPSWTKEVAPGFDGNVWAPDIVQRGDRFYLFYAISAPGKITSAIGLTINKTLDPASPDYSWKDQGIVIRSIEHRDLWNAIDPQVLVDEKGTAWMSFGSFWGGLKMVKLNESWTAPAEPPEWHSLAKRERSVLVDDGDPEPAALEGPFVFRKGPWYYLFISWDYCCRGTKSTYKMVVGRARDFRGPYLDRDGWPDFVVSRNNLSLLAFRNQGVAGRHSLAVVLRGARGNPAAIGARVTLELSDGSSEAAEVSAGSSYYSQSTAACFFGYTDAVRPRRAKVRWPTGEESTSEITTATPTLEITQQQAK